MVNRPEHPPRRSVAAAEHTPHNYSVRGVWASVLVIMAGLIFAAVSMIIASPVAVLVGAGITILGAIAAFASGIMRYTH